MTGPLGVAIYGEIEPKTTVAAHRGDGGVPQAGGGAGARR